MWDVVAAFELAGTVQPRDVDAGVADCSNKPLETAELFCAAYLCDEDVGRTFRPDLFVLPWTVIRPVGLQRAKERDVAVAGASEEPSTRIEVASGAFRAVY